MKIIPIVMSCPIYFHEYKVYCYQLSDSSIIPNGCDQFHPCKECKECCDKAVKLCKEKITL